MVKHEKSYRLNKNNLLYYIKKLLFLKKIQIQEWTLPQKKKKKKSGPGSKGKIWKDTNPGEIRIGSKIFRL